MKHESRLDPASASALTPADTAPAAADASTWDPLAALGYEAADPSLQSALWLEDARGLPGVRRFR
jgi:hypothetical protein